MTGPNEHGRSLKPYRPIKPLGPDKKLMPTSTRDPGHAKFKDMPGQLTLDDMGAIGLPEESSPPKSPRAAAAGDYDAASYRAGPILRALPRSVLLNGPG